MKNHQTAAGRRQVRIGMGLAALTALISGFAVFLNAHAVRQAPDAALYTTLKNGVAALILLVPAMIAVRGGWVPARPRQWAGLVALGVIGGSVPFLLFFNGLAAAGAPAAAMIHKTLFVWVALLAVVLLRERLGPLQLAAIGVLLVAQLMIQPPAGVALGGGEALIAAATAFWAVEVIVAKRLLDGVPSPVAAAARMGFGLVILIGYVAFTGGLGGILAMSAVQWAWVLGTGAVLAGYVASWYAALRRAPAVTVTAVLTLGAPITAGLQVLTGGPAPQAGALGGYLLVLLAVAAIGITALRRSRLPSRALVPSRGD